MGEQINDPLSAASQAGGSAYPIEEVKVDLSKLNALSPEVISKQATVRQLTNPLAPFIRCFQAPSC